MVLTCKVAVGTWTITVLPVDGKKVSIDGADYVFKTTVGATARQVLIGATIQECARSLKRAINDERPRSDFGTSTVVAPNVRAYWTAGTAADPGVRVFVTATVGGTAGNSITTTTDVVGAFWGGATLAGGAA